VDLTHLCLATGRRLKCPVLYDENGPALVSHFSGGPLANVRDPDLLRRAMESEGFTVERRRVGGMISIAKRTGNQRRTASE